VVSTLALQRTHIVPAFYGSDVHVYGAKEHCRLLNHRLLRRHDNNLFWKLAGFYRPFFEPTPTNIMDYQKTTLNVAIPSDEELVRLAQSGRQDAFILLYERYLPTTYTRVRFKVPELDVEDVTQEIFIAVLKSLGSFKGHSKFSTWIWTVTRHKIADYYRAHELISVDLNEYEKLTEHNLSSHAECVERHQDDWATIQHALCQLPKNYQDILLMRFVDDMSFNEIARQNGQSLDATKSLFRRSVAALARKMDGNDE
jgi:RNA polymerase sigma-70 factor, ECF subfamily